MDIPRKVTKRIMPINEWLGDPRAIRESMIIPRADGYGLDATALDAINAGFARTETGVLEAGTERVPAHVRRELEFFGVAIPAAPGTGGIGTPTLPGGVDPESAKPPKSGRRGQR